MAGPDKQRAEPQPLTDSESEPEETLSPGRKIRLFLAARWLFVGFGAAYVLSKVVEDFWLGARFTYAQGVELALVSLRIGETSAEPEILEHPTFILTEVAVGYRLNCDHQ